VSTIPIKLTDFVIYIIIRGGLRGRLQLLRIIDSFLQEESDVLRWRSMSWLQRKAHSQQRDNPASPSQRQLGESILEIDSEAYRSLVQINSSSPLTPP
jgi:hypothetical protein